VVVVRYCVRRQWHGNMVVALVRCNAAISQNFGCGLGKKECSCSIEMWW
jgi:hypothetical protein